MNIETAQKMIGEIGAWLADGAPGAPLEHATDDSLATDLARELASDLLEKSGVDGWGGCRLCRL